MGRPPEAITQHAADEEQRGQEERVALDHPLRLSRAGAELTLQRGQRDVDRWAVDEDHARGEDGRDQHRSADVLRAGNGSGRYFVSDDLLVAGSFEDRYHQIPYVSGACQPARWIPVQAVPSGVQSARTARPRTSIRHWRERSVW